LGDIDHFKRVNDTFGHAAGDTVLCKVAELLTCSVRDYDAVCRYGGEEFLVVFPACEGKTAGERAEHIRSSLALNAVPSGEVKIPVTMSMGIANSAEWASLDAEGLVRRADEALYRAKAEGRNRVVIAHPDGFNLIHSERQLTIG